MIPPCETFCSKIFAWLGEFLIKPNNRGVFIETVRGKCLQDITTTPPRKTVIVR